ncbi:GNAT family N-acetyltransferase [Anaerobacillus isosaccharinicus]|uniref:GNAT family N-acetyltransferase n=1 Tax=Anaerobacillus isosaccharinicus TaxID=1532552 RepID=A0A1S2LZZ5_9BACI|nr:GNAT family protein [Anaerobacillus isosaccharinicus]MBA5586554.1 GNAT family N-acetyltransferase [Anaerobacillus isosaccharinicus]QOY35207.1 GNAT family N-acetyltransferase [Anaerobacillus isosaccharinicus]
MRVIETERLLLRPVTVEDGDRVEELASDYDVSKTTLNIPYPYPEGGGKEFIESVIESEKNGKIAILAIVDKETQHLLGLINLNIAIPHKRGELGYFIGKPYWGMGYGTEAARAIVAYGFKDLALNKIYAAAFTTNPGSWRIMEKIGLKHEGTHKQHVSRFGEFFDLAYYGLVKEDYLKEANQD